MLKRFMERLEASLMKLSTQAEKGRLRQREQAERRIGRLLERYSRAASLYDIQVEEQSSGRGSRLAIHIQKKEERLAWAQAITGSYLLRTNCTERDPKQLWKTYTGLTQLEDAFRITKSDLGIRPIHHQRTDRTQAHILVCFLALAMWRALQQWMSGCGLGTAPRELLEGMRNIHSIDILLPTREKLIRLRAITTAPEELKVLLQRLNLPLPNRSRVIENVVQTLAL